MADNMSNIEQKGISQPHKVAERWLKMRGIQQPQEGQSTSQKEVNPSLIQEAYDLFAEKQDLNHEIVRHQLSLTKPIPIETPEKERWSKTQEEHAKAGQELGKLLETANDNLSLEEKRNLIRQGKIAKLTGTEQSNALLPPQKIAAIKQSQVRIGEIDTRLENFFATPGNYDKFIADLTHQIGVRHQTHEVDSLIGFGQEADLLALRLSREAQVDGRPLTSVEKRTIEENRILKEEAVKRAAELTQNPDVFDRLRIVELKRYRSQLDKDHFVETASRQHYLKNIEQAWTNGEKVLLTGHTGTGKTEIIKHASRALFGQGPEIIRGNEDTNQYDIIGRVGLDVSKGDVRRPGSMIAAMTGRNGRGLPVLIDEMDRIPSKQAASAKELYNVRPGQKGVKPYSDGGAIIDVGSDYAVAATANIKSDKYSTHNELDPEIVRVFDPMEIDYMPPHEVYDLALASLIDKRGCIPLSEQDARTTLKNLCDAASWIQDAYQGRKITTDTSKNTFLEARGKGSTGNVASLKIALLDPGKTVGMLKGWSGAQVRGESFEDYLNSRIVEFINNRAYPEDDRYYLTEIFALKGFLKGVQVDKLSVPGLTQAVLDRWSGGGNKSKRQQLTSESLSADSVVRLDPYKRFVRPVDQEAAEMLKEAEKPVKEAEAQTSESSNFAEAKEIMGEEFFGPDEVEKAFGFEIDRDLIREIPFSAQELMEAKENGQYLMLYVSNKADGAPITVTMLRDTLQDQFDSDGKGKILFKTDWYYNEEFYTTDTPRPAWRLITKDVIPDSLSHNYLEQTEDIVKYLKGTVFKGGIIPADYQGAIDEFEKQKKNIGNNLSSKWQESASKLAGLKLTQMTRQTFVEERYGWLVYFQNRNERLLEDKYNWTGSQASAGGLVYVGSSGTDGAGVYDWLPDGSSDRLGVVLSR